MPSQISQVLPSYKLVKANISHMSAVLSWLESPEELLLWGGPGLIWGLDEAAFAEQLKLNVVSSRALINQNDKVLGFGQYYERVGRVHFGRIGIAKDERGKRLSGTLMSLLMNEATEQDDRELSLFVMRSNVPAIKCYTALGFVVTEYPDVIPGGMTDVDYMVRY